jgi:hypothetical protein
LGPRDVVQGTQNFGDLRLFPSVTATYSPVKISANLRVRDKNTNTSYILYDVGGIIDLGTPGQVCVKGNR